MSWKVGKVKITKITEIAVEGGTRFMLPQATYNEIQQLPWLIPDFATEGGKLKMSIHSLIVETPTRRIIVDTCIGNDKEGRDVPTWNKLKQAVPRGHDQGRLSAGVDRHRVLHAPACRSRRLEHEARERQVGADVRECALHLRQAGIRVLARQCDRRRRTRRCSRIRSSRSWTRTRPSWSRRPRSFARS